jgi:hypothetical protein
MTPTKPTDKAPKNPGWYWFQEREDKPLEVVFVDRSGPSLTIRFVERPCALDPMPISVVKGFWWGAVIPPSYAPPTR